MFKNLSKNLILIFSVLVLGGFIGSISFGVSFFDWISQADKWEMDIWNIFKWKTNISDLYSKSLQLVKWNEIKITKKSLNKIINQIKARNGLNCQIDENDLINILYYNSAGFRITMQQALNQDLSPGDKKLEQSYQKFFVCKNITSTPVLQDYQNVQNEILSIYNTFIENNFNMQTLNQDNYGEDLFWNGTLDDSDFDLMIDMDEIGKVMFEWWEPVVQTLFYRLPELKNWASNSSSDSNNSTNNNPSVNDDLNTWIWNGAGNNSTNNATVDNASNDNIVIWGQNDASQNGNTVSNDVKKFIQQTNGQSSYASNQNLWWNQCITGVVNDNATQQEIFISDEEYISWLVDFIENADPDVVINENLIDNYKKELDKQNGDVDKVINQITEKLMWTSDPECQAMSDLWDQMKCEFEKTKSCIGNCDGLWVSEKILCVTDCSCGMIGWPNWWWWEGVEDMYQIKFCKVPVEKKYVTRWKKVYSIQAIFNEIYNILEWLKTSWEMIKKTKTKESLDIPVKLNLGNLFSFDININSKSIFPQKSKKDEQNKESQTNKKLQSIIGENSDKSEADDYNKYIVVADVAKNKANTQPFYNLETLNNQVEYFRKIAEQYQALAENPVKTSQNYKTVWLAQEVISFFDNNVVFWWVVGEMLNDMNDLAISLNKKIQVGDTK